MEADRSNQQSKRNLPAASLSAPAPFCGPIEITDASSVAEIYGFRAEVWKAEGFAVNSRPDEHSIHARHWIVTSSGETVGAARLCFHTSIEETPDFDDIKHLGLSVSYGFGFLSHLVVCPSARGHRLSTYLDAVRVESARAAGAKAVLGRFFEYRVKGLAALGFRPIADFHNPKFGNRLVIIMQLDLRNERDHIVRTMDGARRVR